MSLEKPIKIRILLRKLYQKAKEEPSYRFYLLYDKMYREDVLAHAYALVRSNQGAPGVDGQSFRGIESQGLEEWLYQLPTKCYSSVAVIKEASMPRVHWILKSAGAAAVLVSAVSAQDSVISQPQIWAA